MAAEEARGDRIGGGGEEVDGDGPAQPCRGFPDGREESGPAGRPELGLGAGAGGGVDAFRHQGGAGDVEEEACGVVLGAQPGDGHGVALELGGAGAAEFQG